MVGHSGDSTDLVEYLPRLADAGSLLGRDRSGLDVLQSFERRVDTVAELLRRGYTDSLVLAHDASCHVGRLPDEEQQRVTPNWRYTHISDDVLPALRQRGASEEQITTMLVDNPRRYFENVGAY